MSILTFRYVDYLRKEKEQEIMTAIGNEEEAREVINKIRSLKDKSDKQMGKVVCDSLIGVLGLVRMSDIYNGLSNATNSQKDIALLVGWGVVLVTCVVRGIINHKQEVQYDQEIEKIENSVLKKKLN